MNKVQAFKNQLRCYSYYLDKLKQLDNQIALNFYKETGVSGIDYSKIPTRPSEEALIEYRLELIEKGNSLAIKRATISHQIEYIEEIVNKMPKPLKKALIDIYINGKKYSEVAMSENLYWTESGLYKAIYRELDKLL